MKSFSFNISSERYSSSVGSDFGSSSSMGGGIIGGIHSSSKFSECEGERNLEIQLQFEICNSSSSSERGRRKSAKVMGFLISLKDSVSAFFLGRGSICLLASFIGWILTAGWGSYEAIFFAFVLLSKVDFDFTVSQPSSIIRSGCTHIVSPDAVVTETSPLLCLTLLISRNSTVFDLIGSMLTGSNDPIVTMLTDAVSYF